MNPPTSLLHHSTLPPKLQSPTSPQSLLTDVAARSAHFDLSSAFHPCTLWPLTLPPLSPHPPRPFPHHTAIAHRPQSPPTPPTAMQPSVSETVSETACCPVCRLRVPLNAVEPHVAQCTGVSPVAIPSIPSPPQSDHGTDDSQHSSDDSGDFESLPPPQRPSSNRPSDPPTQNTAALSSWLSRHGLAKYTAPLLRAGFQTLTDLLNANAPCDALGEYGVTSLGARRKLDTELEALRRRQTHPTSLLSTVVSSVKQPSQVQSSSSSLSAKRTPWQAMFDLSGHAGSSSKRQRTATTGAPASRSSWLIPDPRAAAKKARGTAKSAQSQTHESSKRRHRYSQRVPGTSFTVDSFHAALSDPGCTTFFLTHFHADHYGGLRKTTLPSGARVVCSAVTARLVRSELYVPDEFLHVVDIGKRKTFKDNGNDVTAWFFDANHCPGAMIILFYVSNTKRWVLHTGDCRFEKDLFSSHTKLAEVIANSKLDYMHLDTTYCNMRYIFPPQKVVISQVIDAARAENARTKGRCLFFFGTYSIGKERVFVAVAEALNLHIFAGARKRKILEKIHMPQISKRLVSKPTDARIHVVSMNALSPDGLRGYAKTNKLNTSFIGRGLAIVFRPTGWSFNRTGDGFGKTNRQKDQAIVYDVSYSEHSSYDELCEFVAWAKPARLIPTVNARSKTQADELRLRLRHTDRSLRKIEHD